ncbi:helix-turn-helix domain-containing protein [Pseudomonas sp. dw_358]|uniref:PucR family transcriptional regulator n=1 Tax=Pseudomonas sp. dw_358 TaxID=2720083 RepID=UPI001BD40F3A|nr:helix-turn-helix domain-containing protein [Pseudomonas sp. dw_358]
MQHAVNSLDAPWLDAYDAFSSPQDLATTLKKLTALACAFAPWTISGILAVDHAGGFVELMAETGNRGQIFDLLPTRWPLITSPCTTVLASREVLFFEDVKQCTQYPMYQAEAVAQDFQSGVVMLLEGLDASGRPLVWMLQSQYGQRASDEQFAVAHGLVQVANRAIARALAHEQEQRQRLQLDALSRLGTDLMDEVFRGANLAELASLSGGKADTRVAIIDALAEQVYHNHPGDALDALLLGHIAPGGWRAVDEPALVRLPDAGNTWVRVEPVIIGAQWVGAVVVLDARPEREALERSLLRQVKGAAGALLLRNHVELTQRSRELKRLFEALEKADPDSLAGLHAQARLCQVNLRRPAQLLLIKRPPASAQPPLEHWERRLLSQAPGATLCELSQDLLLRVPCDSAGVAPGLLARLLGTAQSLAQESGQGVLSVARSAVLESAEHHGPAIKGLKQLLRLAVTFGREGLVDDKSFGPFTFLAAALDAEAAPQFVASTIGAIQAYDRQHNTHLLATCVAFSEAGCRFQETAHRLDIHVSTLRYRLARIGELFDIDFSNPDQRFSLELACRLARVLNPTPASAPLGQAFY